MLHASLTLGMARYMSMCTQQWKPLLLENANWHLVDDYLPCSWDSYNPELAQNFNFRPSFASGNNGGTACYTKSGAFAKEIAV